MLDTDSTQEEQAARQAEFRRMRFVANGLFWLALAVFMLATVLKKEAAWLELVQATAGAAVAGAIADWFAITALFRHPLGLKIPHTAIIPNRKDRIAQSFGQFVKANFLSPSAVTEKLRSMDIARRLAGWARQRQNSRVIAHHVAVAAAAMARGMREQDAQRFIEQSVETGVRATQFTPLLGNLLSLIDFGDGQREILYGATQLVARSLNENKATIQAKIGEETPWWMPPAVDQVIYQKIVDVIETTLHQASADPAHPLHQELNRILNQIVEELKHSPDMLTREEAWKEAFLAHPLVQDLSASIWADVKTALLEYGDDPDSEIRRPTQQAIVQVAEAVLDDPELLGKIDGWIERTTLYAIQEYGHEVESLISLTIHRWDAQAASRKIEMLVGKDLQYIRINGTLVGGLVGLVIHALSLLF